MKSISKGILISTIFTIIIYLGVYYLFNPIFVGLNLDFFNGFKKYLSQSTNSNIVVVEIDDLSYNKLGFPIDRKDYLQFLDNLNKSSPAVVSFDILFEDKGKDKEIDTKLAQKFKDLGNIVIGFDIKSGNQAMMPYELFFKSVAGLGYFKPTINLYNNKVYSIKPVSELKYLGNNIIFESFSFVVLRQYYNYLYNKKDNIINYSSKKEYYNFIGKNIPLKNEEFYISYKEVDLFSRESFYNIYSGNFDKKKFKDKIVLIGYTAEGVKDDFILPGIGNGALTKGVYVHANAISNILNDNYVIYFNTKIEKLITLLFIFFVMMINIFYLKNKSLKTIIFLAINLFIFISFLYVIILFLSYKTSGIYLLPNYPFSFLIVLTLSIFISSVIKYKNEDKNKRLLSQALSEYVSSNIAQEILYSTGEVKLSGENKKITIFFSDIEGFTTISEKMSPEELVGFLRVYLGEMSNIILDNRGFINKYEGDAIMALWGVFGTVENFGVINACNSCLIQQAKLNELNKIWEIQGKQKLNVRMGIHCGNAIIGNIGAIGRKMEFTALGDSVNLGSRLEGVNKYYQTNICVSQDVYDIAKEKFIFRYLDKIKVKGKDIGINIYELICRVGEENEFKKEILSKFDLALKCYFSRNFKDALDIFNSLAELGDKPSLTYIKRCEKYLINSPSDDWDGIWVMDEK